MKNNKLVKHRLIFDGDLTVAVNRASMAGTVKLI